MKDQGLKRKKRGKRFVKENGVTTLPFVRYGFWLFVVLAAVSFAATDRRFARHAGRFCPSYERISGTVTDPGLPVPDARRSLREGSALLPGIMTRPADSSGDGVRGGRMQKILLDEGICVVLFVKNPARRGDYLTGFASLQRPSGPRNPGGFSESAWLRSSGADFIGRNAYLTVHRREGWLLGLSRIPDRIRVVVRQNLGVFFAGDTGAILASLTLGDTRLFSEEIAFWFRASGMAHLTSVSGAHLSFFLIPFRLAGTRVIRNKRGERVLLAAVLALPGLLSGWKCGIVRATMVRAAGMIDFRSHRKSDRINTIGFAGAAMLLMHPCSVWDTGFWMSLSSAAVISLTASSGVLRDAVKMQELSAFLRCGRNVPAASGRCRRQASRLAGPLKIAFAAAISVLPYQMAGSSVFFLAAPVFNLAALLLASFLTLAGYLSILILVFLMPFPGALRVVSSIATGLLVLPARALLRIAEIGACAHTLRCTAGELLLVLAAGCFLAAAQAWLRRRVRNASARFFGKRRRGSSDGLRFAGGMLALAVALTAAGLWAMKRSAVWRVLFADVGQGDATLIVSPDGHAVLIDGGDEGEGFRTLIPAVEFFGVREIDAVFVTHGHRDHAAGVQELIRAGLIRRLMIGGRVFGDRGQPTASFGLNAIRQSVSRLTDEEDMTEDLIGLTRARRVPVTEVRSGASFSFGAARMDVLAPTGESRDLNDSSVVLKFSMDGFSILFTGDISATKERELLAADADLTCSVLHVAHHGSRTSTDASFLARASPRAAVISCGARNRFGHPHRETTERLNALGVPTVRTDRGGAVFLIIHRGKGTIRTWIASPLLPFDTSAITDARGGSYAGDRACTYFSLDPRLQRTEHRKIRKKRGEAGWR